MTMAVPDTSIASTSTTDGGDKAPSTMAPSQLFAQTNGGESDTKDEDAEALLQNGLSVLAAQQDLLNDWKVETNGEVSDWIWQSISRSAPTDEQGIPICSNKKLSPLVVEYEWWMGTQFLVKVLPKLSPFEIHSVAKQSIVFTEGSQSHRTMCLLLCAYSLRQCPSPLKERWKRWQSLTCETIHLFQNYGMEMGLHAQPLWIKHIVPACQHVGRQLPKEALHLAILAGMVGTTSTLVTLECDQSKQLQSTSLSRAMQLLTTARTIVVEGGETEEWIWYSPWRSEETFGEQDEEISFENNKGNIAWWNQSANGHEKVAGMDTSWDELGISLMALMAFDDRPMTLNPTFVWNTWFPHVAIIFKGATEYPFLENLPLILLEKLGKAVPDKSLPAVSSTSKKVDAPYETFQLLSNRIIVKPHKKGNNKKSKNEVELGTKTRSERIVGHMKSLLNRYPVVNQIKIVRKLVHECPHPGLQAKFMDLLRPVVFEEACAEAFWSYIGSFIKDLLAHVDQRKDELFNTDDLIEKVEVYVGAITMLQLWSMVKGKLPKKIKGTPLGKFHKILKRSISAWMTDQHAMPPDDYYRLYLLEGAIQQVMRILKEAREKRKVLGNDDASYNDSFATLGSPSENSSHSATAEDDGKEEEPIVGDIDIFS